MKDENKTKTNKHAKYIEVKHTMQKDLTSLKNNTKKIYIFEHSKESIPNSVVCSNLLRKKGIQGEHSVIHYMSYKNSIPHSAA